MIRLSQKVLGKPLALFTLAILMVLGTPSAATAQSADIASILAQIKALQEQIAKLQEAQKNLGQTGVLPANPAGPSLSCTITSTLSRGTKGNDVVCLQKFLISQKLLAADSSTGFFGPLTENAVKTFQSKHGIVSSGLPSSTGFGLVGVKTRGRINDLIAISAIVPPKDVVIAENSQNTNIGNTGNTGSGTTGTGNTGGSSGGGGDTSGGGNTTIFPPPPPPPLPPETPSCTLQASPAVIGAGSFSTISWTTVNATGVTELKQGNSLLLYQPKTQGGLGGTLPTGSQSVKLGAAGNYTFTMSVANTKGSSSCTTTVSVGGTPTLAQLPIVKSGLGLAGFGGGFFTDSERLKRDIVWADGDQKLGDSLLGGFYIPYDREPLGEPNRPLTHDQTWYLANHPDWLVYKNDRTSLAVSYFYGTAPNQWALMPIDISNPEVRNYIWERRVTPALLRGFRAISYDNVGIINSNFRAGVKTATGWKQLFNPADSHDVAYVESIQSFLRDARARLHAQGVVMFANIGYGYGYEKETLAVSRETDVMLMEGAFLYSCKRNDIHVNDDIPNANGAADYWTKRFTTLRTVAEERGLILADICYEGSGTILDMTHEDVKWAIANFLLVRGDKTYMMLTDIKEIYRLVDRPEYEMAEQIGAPVGAPKKEGGVWTRRYQNGLVIVNPSGKNASTYALGNATYKDISGQTYTGSISIAPVSSLVLITQAEQVAMTGWTTDNATFVQTSDANIWRLSENDANSRHRINTTLTPIPNGHTTSELWTLSFLVKQPAGSASRRVLLGLLGHLEQAASAATSICSTNGSGGVAWSGKGTLATQLEAKGYLQDDGWYFCSLQIRPNNIADYRLRIMVEMLTQNSPSGYQGDGSAALLIKDMKLEVRP